MNSFTSSQLSINSGYNNFTQSTDTVQTQQNNRLNSLEQFTQSVDLDFVTDAQFNPYTQSVENTLATLASTGSNTFSGSINSEVIPLTITSQTASIDFSQGNFFTLTLPTSSIDTHIDASNIKAGMTSNVRINTIGSGSVSFSSDFQFPVLNSYIPSTLNTTDILTFVTFDTSLLYGVAVKRLG